MSKNILDIRREDLLSAYRAWQNNNCEETEFTVIRYISDCYTRTPLPFKNMAIEFLAKMKTENAKEALLACENYNANKYDNWLCNTETPKDILCAANKNYILFFDADTKAKRLFYALEFLQSFTKKEVDDEYIQTRAKEQLYDLLLFFVSKNLDKQATEIKQLIANI